MPPSCLKLCQLSVALRIKFKLPGLAPRIMHDLAPATPPVCLSPLTPQHLQFHSCSGHSAAAPQREQLLLGAHFPLCLPLPDMPLAVLPGPAPAPVFHDRFDVSLHQEAPASTPDPCACLHWYTSENKVNLIDCELLQGRATSY